MEKQKPKHPNFVVGWTGTMDELVRSIGNMSYDGLAIFMEKYATEIERQGKADALRPSLIDPTKKRVRLSRTLLASANYLKKAKNKIDLAWKISEPFM